MSLAAIITLLILVGMFVFLLWNRFPVWLVFITTITIAMTLRLAPPAALLKGFSNTGVITVAALYPVAAGMYATGAISLLSERLIGLPKSTLAAQVRIFVPVSLASAFLYNTPLVAMMIPAVRDVTRRTGLPVSKFFMGLSYIALLGGTMTLLGTSVNLIIAGLANEAVAKGEVAPFKTIGLFDPILVGLPAVVVGIVYIILIGSHLVKDRTATTSVTAKRNYKSDFLIPQSSKLIGKTLGQVGLENPVGFKLESIARNDEAKEIDGALKLGAGDKLTFIAPAEALPGLWTTIGLEPAYSTEMSTARHDHQLVELIVSARSPAIGHRIADLPIPDSPYQIMLVGVSRNGEAPAGPLSEFRLEPGDAGVVEVNDAFFYENRRETDFLLTKRLEGFRVQRLDRAIVALLITIAMIAVSAFGLTTLLNAALLATLAMLFTGCLTVDRMWHSVDWRTVVVMGSAVGLESAVTGSGLAKNAADAFASIGGGSPRLALAAVFLGTVLLTNVISNVAAAVLMFSVAVSLANGLGVKFYPFAMVLMFAASCAFINPAGFQTNLMVQEPGGYTFADFAKVGIPLTLLAGAVAMLVAPLVYGF